MTLKLLFGRFFRFLLLLIDVNCLARSILFLLRSSNSEISNSNLQCTRLYFYAFYVTSRYILLVRFLYFSVSKKLFAFIDINSHPVCARVILWWRFGFWHWTPFDLLLTALCSLEIESIKRVGINWMPVKCPQPNQILWQHSLYKCVAIFPRLSPFLCHLKIKSYVACLHFYSYGYIFSFQIDLAKQLYQWTSFFKLFTWR